MLNQTTSKRFLYLFCLFLLFLLLVPRTYFLLLFVMFAVVGVVFWGLVFFPFRRLLWQESEKLRHAFQHVPCGIIFFSSQGKGYNSNAKFCAFFRLPSKTRIFSLAFFEPILLGQSSVDALENIKSAIRRGQAAEEVLHLRLPPAPHSFRFTVRPISRRLSIVFVEEHRALSQTDERTTLYEVLETYPCPVFLCSPEGQILFANKVFQEWTNYDAREIFHKPIQDFIQEEITSWHEVPLNESITFRHRNGSLIKALLYQVQFLKNNEGVCIFLSPDPFVVDTRKKVDLNTFLNRVPFPSLFLDHRGYIQFVNFSLGCILRERRVVGTPLEQWVVERDQARLEKFFRQLRATKKTQQPLIVHLKGGETPLIIGIYATYIDTLSWSSTGGFFVMFYDMTEIRRIENQTLESQKLMALGQLAGGITHDFNNLLTAMLGFCDLLLQRHTPQDQSFTDIMQIKQNATRAANLVRQLLLFAKHAEPEMHVIGVHECLNEISFLLRRLMGPKVELHVEEKKNSQDEPLNIFVDQGQFEQIIMNLAINARDAMKAGGILTFRTRVQTFKAKTPVYKGELTPRTYVVLDIQDTGSGISEEHLNKIFDPFFSTKEPGKGTGLGLATVYQILTQMEGGIKVSSVENEGTTFLLYIPQHKEAPSNVPEEKQTVQSSDVTKGIHHPPVLLVEDEDPIRLFTSRVLKNEGHQVFEARNGHMGLEILKKHPEIRLLITDVAMPGMDGYELVNATLKIRKGLKILFVSGYPQEQIESQVDTKHGVFFLPKPFTLQELVKNVQDALK